MYSGKSNVLASSFWNLAKLLVFAIVVTVTVPLIVAEMIYAVRNNAAQGTRSMLSSLAAFAALAFLFTRRRR